MLIQRNQVIEGFDAVMLRNLFRLERFNVADVATTLDLDEKEALKAIERLSDTEFVTKESDFDDVSIWQTTIKGQALANARIGNPISRAKADELLAGVIDRAKNIIVIAMSQ